MTLGAGWRFHGRSVRLSLPWLGLREWQARNPLRLSFGPMVGMPGEPAPEPGDVLPVFACRPASLPAGGYLIDTSDAQPAAEAALWLLRLDARPAYVLRGADQKPKADGVLRVRVEEVEACAPGTPVSTIGTAEAFYGAAVEEARELLSSVESVLSDEELGELEGAMYDTSGALIVALHEIVGSRQKDTQAWAKGRTRAKARERERFPLYVRFGELPRGGSSRNWEGGPEEGVSCFRARLAEDGAYVLDAAGLSGQLTVFKELRREGREVYLATGTEVGTGGAHEPVLDAGDLELTPLPPGTRLSITDEWQEVITLAYAIDALSGAVYPPHIWRPPEEMVVPEPQHRKPARSVAEVLAATRSNPAAASELHGEDHWRRVAVAGSRIVEGRPGADPLVVLLFALLHDAGRLRDFYDEHHAYRGARIARELLAGGDLLPLDRLETLLHAIERHDAGETSEDPTIGACWDADRLELWRVGIRPDPELLSTEAAVGLVEWGRELGQEQFTWEETMQAYEGGEVWTR